MNARKGDAVARILYVEDDESLAFLTVDQLEEQGFEVVHCSDGSTAWEAFCDQAFDLCILDVMLPNMDGFTLAEKIRRTDPHIPILLLTARSLKEDRIQGFKIGADDYITKPYSMEELILRIQVFLRRKAVVSSTEPEAIILGKYRFEPHNLRLIFGDEEISLTQREAELLDFLIKNRSRVVKRSDILEKIWGQDDYFLGRSLDVFISRLRKHLSRDEKLKIENIHGVGFSLRTEE